MKEAVKPSKATRNYYVDIVSLLPFVFMLFTGIVMLAYHAGKPIEELTFNKDGGFWLNAHIVSALVSMVATGVHLYQHFGWFKKLFSGKQKNKYWVRNLILVLSFLAVTLTSVLPWLVLEESKTASVMLGLHNKLGLLLIVFFVVHLLSYFKWLVNMTKRVFGNKQHTNAK